MNPELIDDEAIIDPTNTRTNAPDGDPQGVRNGTSQCNSNKCPKQPTAGPSCQKQTPNKVTKKHKPCNDMLTVDKIICCKPSRGIKWYRVRYIEQKETEWIQEKYLSPHLVREFHVTKTMRGTKKKQPVNRK